ncbi:MAG TPA: HAMP domain-containing protein [Calditrichaeota bacterium]|nr:HAMP domain-containing protein [Calditrichota bacterium]
MITEDSSLKRFLTSKLQRRFFLYFSGLVLMTVLFISVAVYHFQTKMLLKQVQNKAFSLTSILAYSSLNAILLDDYITIQMLIDSMSEDPNIRSIAILDTSGRVIAANQLDLRGYRYEDPLTKKALHTDIFLHQKEKNASGEEIWDTAVPIYNLDKRIGTARIKYSIEDTYKGLLRTILLIGLFAFVISLVLSFRFSASISKPIADVVKLAEEYGKGNFSASIDIPGDDELGHLARELNKLSRKLQVLVEEKIANENLIVLGEFSSYIIHDLKNPISGLHLLADGLHRKLPDDSPLKKYSTEIVLAAQKLEDFTRRTLDIARSAKLYVTAVNINELIKQVVADIKELSTPIFMNLDPELPEIQADHRMLYMAIKNLVINAHEAIENKGKITIQTIGNDHITIKVSDTGSGIPQDRLATVFRPFFSMKDSGHGLGLAMVKKVVIAHQGKINVESTEGEGTTFIIHLPITPI